MPSASSITSAILIILCSVWWNKGTDEASPQAPLAQQANVTVTKCAVAEVLIEPASAQEQPQFPVADQTSVADTSHAGAELKIGPTSAPAEETIPEGEQKDQPSYGWLHWSFLGIPMLVLPILWAARACYTSMSRRRPQPQVRTPEVVLVDGVGKFNNWIVNVFYGKVRPDPSKSMNIADIAMQWAADNRQGGDAALLSKAIYIAEEKLATHSDEDLLMHKARLGEMYQERLLAEELPKVAAQGGA